jgi:hypothetical protein
MTIKCSPCLKGGINDIDLGLVLLYKSCGTSAALIPPPFDFEPLRAALATPLEAKCSAHAQVRPTPSGRRRRRRGGSRAPDRMSVRVHAKEVARSYSRPRVLIAQIHSGGVAIDLQNGSGLRSLRIEGVHIEGSPSAPADDPTGGVCQHVHERCLIAERARAVSLSPSCPSLVCTEATTSASSPRTSSGRSSEPSACTSSSTPRKTLKGASSAFTRSISCPCFHSLSASSPCATPRPRE